MVAAEEQGKPGIAGEMTGPAWQPEAP